MKISANPIHGCSAAWELNLAFITTLLLLVLQDDPCIHIYVHRDTSKHERAHTQTRILRSLIRAVLVAKKRNCQVAK